MRTFVLISLFIGAALTGRTQKSLTGLWTGSLTNDSSTARQDQSFEIALTQYKEKVYGYSRRTFIVNDTLYYVLKRVKGKVDGDVCEVTDDEYISYNFPGQIDKGIKVTYYFHLNQQDSTWTLEGRWSTNRIRRNFYAMSGTVTMREETNLDNSKLFAHMEELRMAKEVPFYAAYKTPVTAPAASPVSKPAAKPAETELARAEKQTPKQEEVKPQKITRREEKEQKKQTAALNAAAEKKTEDPDQMLVSSKKTSESNAPSTVITKPVPAETVPAPASNKPKQETNTSPSTVALNNAPVINIPAATRNPVAAEFVHERTTTAPQVVNFRSDSLSLALYDNGEIDGDTVSVLLNDEVILSRQGLKASAIKKSIQIPADKDEVKLVLYAENLGRYPPNTGLLVVHDGDDVYQLRFTADLQQNAVIVFKRKKK
ncbi:MAG: hypothetical protein QM781_19985 [Chitinophagaceae bacterium]